VKHSAGKLGERRRAIRATMFSLRTPDVLFYATTF
jgi:hypothetical protein